MYQLQVLCTLLVLVQKGTCFVQSWIEKQEHNYMTLKILFDTGLSMEHQELVDIKL